MKQEIAKAIALLTAEYDLPPFGPERITMWMEALSCFPTGAVARSAANYIKTNKFKPQLADIVEGCAAQLDANWLGADEAWALVPRTEHASAMMTDEIAQAVASVSQMMERQDWTAARMAFKDAYIRSVERAKLEGRLPVYFPSFGTDAAGRVTMLTTAVQKGQITMERATAALPEYAADIVKMCGVTKHPLLEGPSEADKQRLKSLLLTMQVGQ